MTHSWLANEANFHNADQTLHELTDPKEEAKHETLEYHLGDDSDVEILPEPESNIIEINESDRTEDLFNMLDHGSSSSVGEIVSDSLVTVQTESDHDVRTISLKLKSVLN